MYKLVTTDHVIEDSGDVCYGKRFETHQKGIKTRRIVRGDFVSGQFEGSKSTEQRWLKRGLDLTQLKIGRIIMHETEGRKVSFRIQ